MRELANQPRDDFDKVVEVELAALAECRTARYEVPLHSLAKQGMDVAQLHGLGEALSEWCVFETHPFGIGQHLGDGFGMCIVVPVQIVDGAIEVGVGFLPAICQKPFPAFVGNE